MYGNTRRPSGQWAIPRSRIFLGEAWVISSPSNFTLPPAGRTPPEIAFSVVFFPAPLAPIRLTSSPFRTSSASPRTAATLPERHSRFSPDNSPVSFAEGRLDPLRIALDLGGRAVGDDASLRQAHHPVRDAHHHL